MELGLVGLGRMGANMARRLTDGGHRVVTFDLDPNAVAASTGHGSEGVSTLEELVKRLSPPAPCG